MKDRRIRPYDYNTGPQKLYGTIKLHIKTPHDFYYPNSPTFNYWNNFSLEDITKYWNFPNYKEASFCYFQEIDFGKEKPKDIYPVKTSIKDAIIQNSYERSETVLDRNYALYSKLSSSLAVFFTYLAYLAA